MDTLSILLVTGLIGFVLYYFLAPTNNDKHKNLPPGNYGLPFLGELPAFVANPVEFMNVRKQKYGLPFKSFLFFRPTVVTSGTEALKFVATQENKTIQNSWPSTWRQLLGPKSLAVLVGKDHSVLRKLLTPAFAPEYLSMYTEEITKITEEYFKKWEREGEKDFLPESKSLAFDIAIQLLLGGGFEGEIRKKTLENFRFWLDGFGALIPLDLPFLAFGKALQARKNLLQIAESELKKKIKNRKEGDAPTCALDIMINFRDEEGRSMTLEELQDQIILQLFAGHDTTSATFASCLYSLHTNKHLLEPMRKEVNELWKEGESLSFNVIKSMKLVDNFVKEVLRFSPPISMVSKETTQDVEHAGFTIPAGFGLSYHIRTQCHNPEVWEEPNKFDPNRFEAPQKPYSFASFGQGPRMCLGMELAKLEVKAFLIYLLKKYEFSISSPKQLIFPIVTTAFKVSFTKLENK